MDIKKDYHKMVERNVAYRELYEHAEKIGWIPGDEADEIEATSMVFLPQEAYVLIKAKQEYNDLFNMTDKKLKEWIRNCIGVDTIYDRSGHELDSISGYEFTRCSCPKIIVDTYRGVLSYGLHDIGIINICSSLCDRLEQAYRTAWEEDNEDL